MICVIEAAKIRERQNASDVEDTWLFPLGDGNRGFADFSLPRAAKIPVVNPGVERPEGGIFGSISMFNRDPNFRRLCSLKLGIE